MGQLGQVGRDRRLRRLPAVRPQRGGHRIGDRLGPERPRRPRTDMDPMLKIDVAFRSASVSLIGTAPRHRHCRKERSPCASASSGSAASAPSTPRPSPVSTSSTPWWSATRWSRPPPRPSPRSSAPQVADSPEAVLAAGVDGIVVAAATDAHPALILAAVEGGYPGVLREAGRAKHVRGSLEVLRAVEDSGVPVQIGYQPPLRRGLRGRPRGRPATVELGQLHTVRSTTLDPAPPPRVTSRPPAASSGTARCTTSTSSAG